MEHLNPSATHCGQLPTKSMMPIIKPVRDKIEASDILQKLQVRLAFCRPCRLHSRLWIAVSDCLRISDERLQLLHRIFDGYLDRPPLTQIVHPLAACPALLEHLHGSMSILTGRMSLAHHEQLLRLLQQLVIHHRFGVSYIISELSDINARHQAAIEIQLLHGISIF